MRFIFQPLHSVPQSFFIVHSSCGSSPELPVRGELHLHWKVREGDRKTELGVLMARQTNGLPYCESPSPYTGAEKLERNCPRGKRQACKKFYELWNNCFLKIVFFWFCCRSALRRSYSLEFVGFDRKRFEWTYNRHNSKHTFFSSFITSWCDNIKDKMRYWRTRTRLVIRERWRGLERVDLLARPGLAQREWRQHTCSLLIFHIVGNYSISTFSMPVIKLRL